MDIERDIRIAAGKIKEADAVLITAGAGIGVDSGLPDFRGDKGFWKAYPPIAKLGLSFSEMANPRWFEQNPELAWAFYGHRLDLYRKTVPHKGFSLMLKWAEQKPSGYFVFTSNVDGQFQKAGFKNSSINEVHGSIHFFQCSRPCSDRIWDASDIEVKVDMESFRALPPLPVCPECGAVARPNILMFGDWSWVENRSSRQYFRYMEWLHRLEEQRTALVIIEAGAGSAVPTVRLQSESIYSKLNASLIRINPREFAVPRGAIAIPLGTKEALERIGEYLR